MSSFNLNWALQYCCYVTNRESAPDIRPESWANIFMRWQELEFFYQLEKEIKNEVAK